MLTADAVCDKLQALGFGQGKRVRLYGEDLYVTSDPFYEEGAIAVRAITSKAGAADKTVGLPIPIVRMVDKDRAG